MRNLTIIVVLLNIFLGCSHPKDKVVISPNLSRNLELIIEKHDSLIKSTDYSFNSHIYNVRFDKNQNDCYIIISTSNFYNRRLMDAYLLQNENLIVFENTLNNPCNNHIKIEHKNIIEKELFKYTNIDEGVDTYRGFGWVFRIDGDSLILHHQGRLKINFPR